MQKVTALVEKKIALLLPENFALVFDGWTLSSFYFFGVFASYSAKNQNGFLRLILSFSIFENEADHSAAEHRRYMEYVLDTTNSHGLMSSRLSDKIAL